MAGNIFCGHGGTRLCITTSGKGRKRQDGTNDIRIRYTYQTKNCTHGNCDGKKGYTVEKLDAIIDSIIRGIFSWVCKLNRNDVLDVCYKRELVAKKIIFKKLEKELNRAESDLGRLKTEIMKSLSGESAFSTELLSEVIKEQEQRCSELRGKAYAAQKELEDGEAAIASMGERYDDLLKWSAAYDTASMSAKKMIVSRMIDRVDVYRGYQLKLRLNISVEQFLVSLENTKTSKEKSPALK